MSQLPPEALPSSLLQSEYPSNLKPVADSLPHRGVYTEPARAARLEFLRNHLHCSLASFTENKLSAESLKGNIENHIGSVEIPIGVAGPLQIQLGLAQESIFAPIATTEGALVASITRGAKAANLSGGITTRIIRQSMSRAPTLEFNTMDQAFTFATFTEREFAHLQLRVKDFSRFSELLKITPTIMGKTLHLRFDFSTGDAAGQNMATLCTANICKELITRFESQNSFKVKEFYLEGNLSSDKKISHLSIIAGRGTHVSAECLFKKEFLRSVLKVSPEEMIKIYHRGQSSAVHSGMVGFNINAANVVAGVFTATGQDIGCVHESSTAQLHLETHGEDLYASYSMPNLVVGTVGGGTRLQAQSELLEMMGCLGDGHSQRLAQIITAFSLALDVSTLAAIVSGQFASAHERLGRNSESLWLKQTDLNQDLFSKICLKGGPADAKIESIAPIRGLTMGNSIVMESTASTHVTKRLCGLLPFEITFCGQDNQESQQSQKKLRTLLKIKPTGEEVCLAAQVMASHCNPTLGRLIKENAHLNHFAECHTRELAISQCTDPRFTTISPKQYGTLRDDRREIYILAQELLCQSQMELMDSIQVSAKNPTKDPIDHSNPKPNWTQAHLKSAVCGIAGFHAIHFGKDLHSSQFDWVGYSPNLNNSLLTQELSRELLKHAHQEFPSFLLDAEFKKQSALIESIPQWWTEIDQMPKTLIHNDFNPRNIAFRTASATSPLQLCAYDWELVTRHLPQRDLAELLCFTCNPETGQNDLLVKELLELHRQELFRSVERPFEISNAEWHRGFQLSLYDFLIGRLAMYFIPHTLKSLDFLKQTVRNTHALIRWSENYVP